MKKCTKCGIEKPLSEFHKATKAYDGLQARCKLCHSIVTKNYNNKNKEKRKIYNKIHNIEKNYGISFLAYSELLKSQNSKCAICNVVLIDGKTTHLDHCHTTGTIRGVLCNCCNTAIGLLKDSIENLKSAQKYLEKYNLKTEEK